MGMQGCAMVDTWGDKPISLRERVEVDQNYWTPPIEGLGVDQSINLMNSFEEQATCQFLIFQELKEPELFKTIKEW
jgi:hypothetical protein